MFLPIRYADDFVVLVTGTEEQARDEKEALAAFLAEELKLVLSPEKTRITALTEGFLFLGHRVRLRWDDRWGYWPRIEIPKDRIKDLRHRIKQLTTLGRHRLSFQEVIDDLNPLLLGWGRFYQHCYGAKTVFSRIDHYVWDRLRRWLRKKFPKTPRLVVRRRYWRRLPDRNRYRWIDQRPVAIVADLKVGRHNLVRLRYPDYAQPVPESPVHNERCTPGSGTGAGETAGGNPGIGAPPPRSLKRMGAAHEHRARPQAPLRGLHPQVHRGGAGAGVQLAPRPARGRAGLHRRASAPRAGSLCRDHYDDGGFSGGTLERPALQRLLRDVEAGLIDVIVVYKIDRLSRSLMDFAKLVEVFEQHDVTFVSVTQQFNTTTSMGRLTLNILLSFAQFEREVIGERIRDKFAASRRKGMWMGGNVAARLPGRGRKLVVDETRGRAGAPDLRPVRRPRLGAQGGARAERGRRGHQALERGQQAQRRSGLDKGDVYKILNNRIYLGAGGAQGRGLSRRARRDHRPGALGQGARRHGRADPPARRHQPGAGAGAAQGPDLRPERPGDVAVAHASAAAGPPLLRRPATRSPRATTAARSRACRRRTSRRRCWRRCSGC